MSSNLPKPTNLVELVEFMRQIHTRSPLSWPADIGEVRSLSMYVGMQFTLDQVRDAIRRVVTESASSGAGQRALVVYDSAAAQAASSAATTSQAVSTYNQPVPAFTRKSTLPERLPRNARDLEDWLYESHCSIAFSNPVLDEEVDEVLEALNYAFSTQEVTDILKRIIRRPPITPNRAQQIRFRHLQRASTAAAEAKRKSEETHESETQKKPRSDEQHTSIDLTVDNTTANDVDSVTSKTTVTPDMSEEVKRLQAEVNRLRGLEESHTHARELKEANEALKSRLANHEKEIAFQKIRESRLESEVETLRRCNRTFEDMNGRLRAQNAMLRVKVQDCVTCRNNRIEMRTLYDKLKEAERSQNGGKGVPKKREGWTARHKPVVDNTPKPPKADTDAIKARSGRWGVPEGAAVTLAASGRTLRLRTADGRAARSVRQVITDGASQGGTGNSTGGQGSNTSGSGGQDAQQTGSGNGDAQQGGAGDGPGSQDTSCKICGNAPCSCGGDGE